MRDTKGTDQRCQTPGCSQARSPLAGSANLCAACLVDSLWVKISELEQTQEIHLVLLAGLTQLTDAYKRDIAALTAEVERWLAGGV